ncbi:MAG: glycosyltransferase [Vicingus serpentipes]|nr:glycosyltransferase [Vicingus serpentipes]
MIIGADKQPLAFLKQEFLELPTVIIPGYMIRYGKKRGALKLLWEGIRFYQSIKKEQELVDQLLKDNNIDCIISDNRYGLRSKQVKSIIITHQLFVKTPLLNNWFQKKIKQLITPFDECWIPDVEGEDNFSGDLSHIKKIEFTHRFIGLLSRFENSSNETEKYDVVAIVSGPEPQRSIFYNLLLAEFKKNQLKAVLVAGNPQELQKTQDENVTIFSHLPTLQMQDLIAQSKVVICRAGYSSIMDLVALRKKAILVPTPGQPEQEYLADYHYQQGNFYTQNQRELDLEKALIEVEQYVPPSVSSKALDLDFLDFK